MGELFYILAVLACPVAMGGMMWFMMRGSNNGAAKGAVPAQSAPAPSDAEIVAMRAELDQLHAELRQARKPGASAAGDAR